MMKTFLFILLAAAITFGAIVYQRATGPTYPKKVELTIENQTYQFELIRSHGGESDCRLEFAIADPMVTGKVTFRKFPTNDDWTTTEMIREGDMLVGFLPHQPPAGSTGPYDVRWTVADNTPVNNTKTVNVVVTPFNRNSRAVRLSTIIAER